MAGAGHDHVHVGIAGRVFGVFQIEQRCALDDAHGNGGDGLVNRRFNQFATSQQAIHGVLRGDKRSCDTSGAGAAIGLNHVTIQMDGALAQLFKIKNGA